MAAQVKVKTWITARNLCAIFVALLLALAPLTLAGCDEAEEKTHVTVSVWDDSVISSGFANYIDSLNPDYDIEWIVGDDSLAFYEYQAEQGSLPDVILAKDFNHVEAEGLSESLYSLNDTDLVATYDESLLSQIPGNSEDVKYVPGASGFEGIIINEYLFDLYDIAVPTDRESFLAACQAFSERGIRGFVAGLGDSETCYEVMQGFADALLVSETEDLVSSILTLGSNATTSTSLDNSAFDDVATYITELVDQTVIQASDMSLTEEDAENLFVSGGAAMLFISDGQASTFGEEHNMTVRALPFFGESTSWAFVEPVFVGMVSNVQTEGVRATASDETLHAAAVSVLTSIMSEEAQAYYLSLHGIDEVVPTSTEVDVTLPDALTPLQASIEESRVRLYLSDATVANSLGAALQDLATGEVSSEDAATTATDLLQEAQEEDEEEVVSFSEGVSYLFDDEQGNVAASDVDQVAAQALECDLFVSSALTIRCPLYAGGKTATELEYAVAETPVYTAELTGEQIESLISTAVANAADEYELPVVSGLHIEVQETDDGYQLASITRITDSGSQESGSGTTSANEGRANTAILEADATYTVGLSAYDWEMLAQLAASYGFASQDETLQDVWVAAFEDGVVSALPAYQDYFAFV